MEDTTNERRLAHAFRNFRRVLEAYDFHDPLAKFLTRFYKENRQMGASDRRTATRLCYNYFRSGSVAAEADLLEKLTISEFLCETESDFVARYRPLWHANMGLSVREKVGFLEKEEGIPVRDWLFPFADRLSKSIDREAFVLSHLTQPDLFIRVRRAKTDSVERELSENGIPFERIGPNGYRLPNGTRLEDLKKNVGDFEVQDLSSQQVGGFIGAKPGEKWWDACAGSGGKALMLLDECPDIDLWVSDLRPGILRNLDERFRRADIRTPYRSKVLDLTGRIPNMLQKASFDGILLDAPCSGSGTWSRTPERMVAFSLEKLSEFSELQRKIAANLVPCLKPGGVLVYVTCSVFEDENEAVARFLGSEHGLAVEKTETIKGYGERADSMFVAKLSV